MDALEIKQKVSNLYAKKYGASSVRLSRQIDSLIEVLCEEFSFLLQQSNSLENLKTSLKDILTTPEGSRVRLGEALTDDPILSGTMYSIGIYDDKQGCSGMIYGPTTDVNKCLGFDLVGENFGGKNIHIVEFVGRNSEGQIVYTWDYAFGQWVSA